MLLWQQRTLLGNIKPKLLNTQRITEILYDGRASYNLFRNLSFRTYCRNALSTRDRRQTKTGYELYILNTKAEGVQKNDDTRY